MRVVPILIAIILPIGLTLPVHAELSPGVVKFIDMAKLANSTDENTDYQEFSSRLLSSGDEKAYRRYFLFGLRYCASKTSGTEKLFTRTLASELIGLTSDKRKQGQMISMITNLQIAADRTICPN
jgi:hypothetical protein